MGKHANKVDKALKARKDSTPKGVAKFKFHLPGSQNKKKGY